MEHSLVVEQVAFGGRGLARLPEGKVCFVPEVIPGERIRVTRLKEKSSYAEAEAFEVSEASPDRIDPPCPVYGICGGCHYQHIRYGRQLEIKRDQVSDVLRRIGGVEQPPVESTVASPREFHYRNRITVHARAGRVGFYRPRSRTVVDIEVCPIASDAVNNQLDALRRSRPVDGEYPLREQSEFRGFRQTNDACSPLLLDAVERMASPGGGLLVDAFCGAGFFAKRLRPLFAATVGIEWSQDAIRSARQSAQDGETYLLGDVKVHLYDAMAVANPEATTVLLDPPAEGVEEEVICAILSRGPARVIYVSCNPATLARDIKRLGSAYQLRQATPVDMFPQTAEIEVTALLEKVA